MARLSDRAYLEAEIKEAGLKGEALVEFLKDKVVSAVRIAKKATKTVTK